MTKVNVSRRSLCVKRLSQERVKIREYFHSTIISRKGFDYEEDKDIIEEEKDQRRLRRNE